jgi:hypothetical protein
MQLRRKEEEKERGGRRRRLMVRDGSMGRERREIQWQMESTEEDYDNISVMYFSAIGQEKRVVRIFLSYIQSYIL